MKKYFRLIWFLLFFSWSASAQNIAASVSKNIENAKLIGESDLKFLGLKVYHISLWSADANFSYDKKFAIQIRYNMNFNKEELAQRSVDEIERLHALSESEKKSYYEKFLEIFASVKKGDEKVALFVPNQGVMMFYNNQLQGQISDKKLARLFVDIWLDERGSYPQVTKKVLGKND